ncbi:MAG: RIP metalloprotease RseP [Planctomycetota bacterium]
MHQWLATAWIVTEVALGFGLIIFIHELGHFLVAKACGVRVLRFSIGFGPKLFGLKRGPTEYQLSLLPLGGYVKMAGEFLGDEKTGAPDEFSSKKPWQRFVIVAAGPLTNLILAIPLCIALYRVGIQDVRSRIDAPAPKSPAEKEGLRKGDLITAINGEPVVTFQDVYLKIYFDKSKGPLVIDVLRKSEPGDERLRVTVHTDEDGLIGITPFRGLTLSEVAFPSPAYWAGLRNGDVIRSVNGKDVRDFPEFVTEIMTADPKRKNLLLGINRGGRDLSIAMSPRWQTLRDYGISEPAYPAVVDAVMPKSPAAAAGFLPGDRIEAVDGKPVRFWHEMSVIVRASGGAALNFAVRRNGLTAELVATPVSDGDGQPARIGVTLRKPDMPSPCVIGETGPAARRAGIHPGDEIDSINGRRTATWADVDTALEKARGPLSLNIRRERGTQTVALVPDEHRAIATDPHEALDKLGLDTYDPMPLRYGWKRSTTEGLRTYRRFVMSHVDLIRGLVARRIKLSEVQKGTRGPIGIVQMMYDSAKRQPGNLLKFFAFINVVLGLMNLLPIPILDGGHIAFIGIEKLRGRPLPERTIAAAQYAGLALILLLVISATWNDIRLF